MLKITLGLLILVFLFIGLISYQYSKSEKSIISAITQTGRKVQRILYTEKILNGEIVFYKHIVGGAGGESYACCFLKRTFLGWKWVDGGEHSGNINSQFIPASANTPFPLFYGEIKDNDVSKIKILEKQKNVYFSAKVINNGNIRIWYLFTADAFGSKFEILGLSKQNATLTSDSIDISPLKAEQNN